MATRVAASAASSSKVAAQKDRRFDKDGPLDDSELVEDEDDIIVEEVQGILFKTNTYQSNCCFALSIAK